MFITPFLIKNILFFNKFSVAFFLHCSYCHIYLFNVKISFEIPYFLALPPKSDSVTDRTCGCLCNKYDLKTIWLSYNIINMKTWQECCHFTRWWHHNSLDLSVMRNSGKKWNIIRKIWKFILKELNRFWAEF